MGSKKGFGLIEVVIVLGLLGIAAAISIKMIKRTSFAQRHTSLNVDYDIIRNSIATYLDCSGTFSDTAHNGFDINPLTPVDGSGDPACESTTGAITDQVGPYLWLRRRTLNGSTQYLTDQPDAKGWARLGNWLIRASCSDSEQTVIVWGRQVNPLQGQVGQDRLIFGSGNGSFALCYGADGFGVGGFGYPWHNESCPYDVNDDNYVSPLDALVIINKMGSTGQGPLELPPPVGDPPPYYDVNRDNQVTRSDALDIITCLNTERPPCDGTVCNATTIDLPPRGSWHNISCPWDVNNSGSVTPLDALLIINRLGESHAVTGNNIGAHDLIRDCNHTAGACPTAAGVYQSHVAAPPFIDVNNNDIVEREDALAVINRLNVYGNSCP